jgi:hypothetical protein
MEGLGHCHADDAHADHADRRAVDAGKVVGHHAVAEGDVVALLDFGVRPRKAAQQYRGAGGDVFGHGGIAAAGHVGDRDAEFLQRGFIEAVDAGAGDLHHFQCRALEQGGRQLRAHCGHDHGLGLFHQCRQVGVVRLAVGDVEVFRRRDADAGEIGFGAEADDVYGHDLKTFLAAEKDKINLQDVQDEQDKKRNGRNGRPSIVR